MPSRQGLIHRDIKPENILLSDRHAMVADSVLLAMNRRAARSRNRVRWDAGLHEPEQAACNAEWMAD
jgi:serine/threonine protein kinase